MDVESWLAIAQADAERRKLPELKIFLEGLAIATHQLRRAPWNDDASGRSDAPLTTTSK